MNAAEISKRKAELSMQPSVSRITIDRPHHAASVAAVAPGSPVLRKVAIPVQGMTCAACQSRVQRVVQAEPGVVDASVHGHVCGLGGGGGSGVCRASLRCGGGGPDHRLSLRHGTRGTDRDNGGDR